MLIISREKRFSFSFLISVEDDLQSCVQGGGGGAHQNKLQAAALVREVLLLVMTGVCDSLLIFLSL